jgi:predicted transposase YdaD
MCKAIEDMMNDSRSEGHSEGLAEGRNQGRSEGLVEGRNQGRSEGLVEANINTALRMLEKGKYSIDEIAELVELPIEKVQELSNHKAV